MAHLKKDSGKKKGTIPRIKDQIIEKISVALEEFRAEWGEKNFKRKMKKAGKLLSGGTKKKTTPARKAVIPADSTIKKIAASKNAPKPQAVPNPKIKKATKAKAKKATKAKAKKTVRKTVKS
jgi:hypothetical protein